VQVNHNFQTNDPCIYAGGNFVKFSRKYRQTRNVGDFCSREVGRAVARSVLRSMNVAAVAEDIHIDADEQAPMSTGPLPWARMTARA
jgi:hypothetical protein